MGPITVGDIVLISFPYADFSKFKKRPALVVGQAEFNNFILCQITSQANTSKRAVLLVDTDFASGSLNLNSYIRPDKLFTVERSVIERKAGSIKTIKLNVVKAKIKAIFS